MREKLLAFVAVGLMATATMTACDDSGGSGDGGDGAAGGGEAKVGVILPDTKSSQRWVADDPKYLKAAFDAAGIRADIQNAQGNRDNFVRIAESMISDGAKILVIANLDAGSGKAVVDKAHAKDVKVIDYDRFTVNGGADYYVSFDNERVGELMGRGLVDCLEAKGAVNPVVAELNGSPTDNKAAQFKAGYDFVLQSYYDDATYTKGPDQWVPDWDNDEAGKIFAQMFSQQKMIRGVLAADDGIAAAVIAVLKEHGLNRKVPVTGQDATIQGLQNLLTGDQCLTVYKMIEPEAQAAANLAAKLFRGEEPIIPGEIKDPESGAFVPFVALLPQAITVKDINTVVADGFVTKEQLCTGDYAQLCKAHGVK